jgi:hypothetical protein
LALRLSAISPLVPLLLRCFASPSLLRFAFAASLRLCCFASPLLLRFAFAATLMKIEDFLASLETQRIAYSKGKVPPKRFGLWIDLLRESKKSNSSGRRSLKNRSRSISLSILRSLGPDVFLLCTSAASMDNLAKLDQKNLISKIQQWWNSAPHPPQLSDAAQKISQKYSLFQLVSTQEPPEQSAEIPESAVNQEDWSTFLARHRVKTFGITSSFLPVNSDIWQRMQ